MTTLKGTMVFCHRVLNHPFKIQDLKSKEVGIGNSEWVYSAAIPISEQHAGQRVAPSGIDERQ